jgi:hypothetical protein
MGAKGQPKTPGSGRKKGSSLSATLREELDKRNFNVIEEFIKAYPSQENQCELLLRLMQYIYPIPREVGLDFEKMTIDQLRQFGGLILESIRSRAQEVDARPRELMPDANKAV